MFKSPWIEVMVMIFVLIVSFVAIALFSWGTEASEGAMSGKAIWGWLFGFFMLSFVIALVAVVGGILFKFQFRNELAANIITELGSIAVTVVVIAELNHWRNIQQEKRQLISQMGSKHNEIATEAVRLLRLKGWLTNGALQGAHLREANLQEAELWDANLKGADQAFPNLQEADLSFANLQEADLAFANLQEAELGDANLQNAFLSDVLFDEGTILPDGSKWTPYTDLMRFFDTNHPHFWRSDNPDSPAYRGDNAS